MKPYRKLTDYRSAWEKAYTQDPPVPLNIDLELASLCNLRCPMCFIPDPSFDAFIKQKSDDGRSLRRLMPVEMALSVIDQCIKLGVPALKFNWRGESTLHPNYSEIVHYASCANDGDFIFSELLANTNANCPDKSIDGLMACTKVMISLDSMIPEIYKAMRVGGELNRAMEVVWKLISRGHKNVWVRRVLTKLNQDEDFSSHVIKEWGTRVKISEHFCFDRNAAVKAEVSGCDHDMDFARKYCGYPSQRLVISSTGKVYPCCIDLHETMPVGDITKQTIEEIWNGEEIKELRNRLRNGHPIIWSETCSKCESWMSYDSPQREYVQDREVNKHD